jgi:hypothetical protein
MARRDEGASRPAARYDRGPTKPDGLLRENPPGGESFARGLRWLVPYSPLRGCSELAVLAPVKILRRRPPPNFKTGSKSRNSPTENKESMTSYTWTVRDRNGRSVVREVRANTSAESRAILEAEGCTDFKLMEDEISEAVRAGFTERPIVDGKVITTTAAGRISHRGKPKKLSSGPSRTPSSRIGSRVWC